MIRDLGTDARGSSALRVAAILTLVVFAAGCSPASWQSLELGDVLGVRGQRLEVAGRGPLEGSVGWSFGMEIRMLITPTAVRRARFGIGTASSWTLIGALPANAEWPKELVVARTVWDVQLAAAGRRGIYTFELEAGQTLRQVEPCHAAACSYAFVETDAHRDVFSFEVATEDEPSLDEWLDAVERGIEGQVGLALYVTISVADDLLPMTVAAAIPLAPSGAILEFRP